MDVRAQDENIRILSNTWNDFGRSWKQLALSLHWRLPQTAMRHVDMIRRLRLEYVCYYEQAMYDDELLG